MEKEHCRPTLTMHRIIPTPATLINIMYDAGPGCEKYEVPTLQSSMGLQDHTEEFENILSVIREVWRELGVDSNVGYKSQDPALMQEVKEEALRRLPFVRDNYEDGWPITFYLKKALRIHTSRGHKDSADGLYQLPSKLSREKLKRKVLPARATRGKPNRHHATTPLGSPPEITSAPHATRRQSSTMSSSSSFTRASTSSQSLTSSGPSIPRTMLKSCTLPIRGPTFTSTSTPGTRRNASSASDDMRTVQATSDSESSGLVPDLLSTYGLPQSDANRLTKLFASFGIVDMTYLRVFARMHSRDAWLRELRENGEISEIQRRVLCELLEHIAED